MMVDASAVVAILARRPGAAELLAALDAHGGPFLATPVALLEAVAELAHAKAGAALNVCAKHTHDGSARLGARPARAQCCESHRAARAHDAGHRPSWANWRPAHCDIAVRSWQSTMCAPGERRWCVA